MFKSEGQRLVQFHRLILLMNVDDRIDEHELQRIHEIGLRMELSPFAVEKVLQIMKSYPKGVIPPEKFIEIFRRQYN